MKALHEPIAAGTAVIGAADVFGNADWLSITEHRQTHRVDMTMPAHDPVERIGLRAAPPRQVEPSRHSLVLAIQVLEQGHQFVTLDENARRVRNQQLADSLIGGIVRSVPNRQWLLG